MFESKVSTVKSDNWDNFSVMKGSKATGFIPIPCPSHQNYSITNICKSPGCIQPLCPQCITGHVQLHQKTKKPAKIQNIVNTRINCIDKLTQILQDLNADCQKYQNSCGNNLDTFLQKNRKKIQLAKSKLQNFVSKYFEELQQKIQLLQIAYINQKQKKTKQMKVKLTPLINHIQEITQYKQELQSEQYIPALIELLNDPPKKPQTLIKPEFENFGEVKIDEQSFQNLKVSLQSFIKVQSLLPESNQFSQQINTNNSRFSNQMKFSKIGRSSSRQLIQSKLQGLGDSVASRSNSRKKIFSNEKKADQRSRIDQSTISRSISNQKIKEIPKIKIIFDQKQEKVSLIDKIYFRYQKGLLAYFQPYQKYLYAVDSICAETGFEKYDLPQNIIVPFDHQCIITPDCRLFLLGGMIENSSTSNLFEIILKHSNRQKPIIKNLASMKQQRSKFSSVYLNESFYVFGGKKGKQILAECQKYSLKHDSWEKIASMPERLYCMNTCVFNDKIFKIGGILQTGQILNRIDVFYPEQNYWLSLSSEVPFFLKMGSCQINNSQMIIFGGQTQFNRKKNECYLLTEQKSNEFRFSPCSSYLYDQGSFQSSYVCKNSILAIQNGENGKNKIIMQLQGNKWRFLSC